MFSHLCKSEEQRSDYHEYELDVEEDDDANISILSSNMDSVESMDGEDVEEEDWESLNETSRTAKIGDALRQLGDVSKKHQSEYNKRLLRRRGRHCNEECKKDSRKARQERGNAGEFHISRRSLF